MRILAVAAAVILLVAGASATIWYFSGSGNDANSGTSWAQAKRTPYDLRELTSIGDTVFFGTGTYYIDTFSIAVDTGTVIACSSFADTNGSGKWHFAVFQGGKQQSGWSNYSGNVYRIANNDTSDAGGLFQNDSIMRYQTSISAVDAPGEFTKSSGYLYVYCYDLGSGYDPDNYYMNYVFRPILVVLNYLGGGRDRTWLDGVIFHGIYFKYGSPQIVRAYDALHLKNTVFRKCKFTHATSFNSVGSDNPCMIHSGTNDSPNMSRGLVIASCSLGYSRAHSGADHGTGITLYNARNVRIDSSVFFGTYTGDCIQFKRDVDSSVVRYCRFDPTSAMGGIKFYSLCDWDSIYFNTVYANFSSHGFYMPDITSSGIGRSKNMFCLFNTIVGQGSAMNAYDVVMSSGEIDPDSVYFKYNVYYWSSTTPVNRAFRLIDSSIVRHYVIDSNAYYMVDTTKFYVAGTGYTWGTWRSVRGHDLRSDLYSSLAGLGFIDYPTDLRRNVSAEISPPITVGGVQCTKYGAYQDAPAATATRKLFMIRR
mgnify:CR=1 FL=1